MIWRRGGDCFSQGADPVIEAEDSEFVAQAMTLLPMGPLDGESWGTWTAAVKAATGRKGARIVYAVAQGTDRTAAWSRHVGGSAPASGD